MNWRRCQKFLTKDQHLSPTQYDISHQGFNDSIELFDFTPPQYIQQYYSSRRALISLIFLVHHWLKCKSSNWSVRNYFSKFEMSMPIRGNFCRWQEIFINVESIQQRIQDFPMRGAPTRKGTPICYLAKLPKTAWKRRKLDWEGEGARPKFYYVDPPL